MALVWPCFHVISEPSGILSRNPLALFGNPAGPSAGTCRGVGFLVLPLILNPVPCPGPYAPIWAWQGVISRYQIGPNWALVIPLFNPGRPYPNLPLGYQPYRAELFDLYHIP